MNVNLSKTFDILRFPLAVLVVFLHISPVVAASDEFAPMTSLQHVYMLTNLVICKVATCAVPTFFFISGYLMMIKTERITLRFYTDKLKIRFRTLFIPYVLWNILAYFYLSITDCILGTVPSQTSFSLQFLLWKPADFPLWFLRDLILLTLAFPLFFVVAKKVNSRCVSLILFLFVISPVLSLNLWYKFIPLAFYFVGCWCGVHKKHLDNINIYIKNIVIFISLILLLLEIKLGGKVALLIDHAFLVFGTAAFLIIGHWFVSELKIAPVKILSASSFFIFCAHKLGATYLSKLGFDLIPMDYYLRELVKFILCPFLTCAICLAVYWCGYKICPRIMNILTGRKLAI